MRNYLHLLGVAMLGGLMALSAACGKKSTEALANEGSKLFASADAGVKSAWEAAVAADKTNGYVFAISTLQMLVAQPGLTDKQNETIRNTLTAISDKMYDRFNKGDAAAGAAIEELRTLRGR